MKKLKLAIYLLTLVFALTGCKKDVHVKTISEIKQMNKSQKQKSQKNKRQQMPAGREVFQVVCQNMS